jgi:acyl carrier protein
MPELVREDAEREIRSFLSSRFPGYRDDMSSDASLESVVDSLGLFDLVEWVETTFAARVPNEEFSPQRFGSIDAIVATVEEFRQG